MSTFKRSLSAFMAFIMVLSVFSGVAGVFAPKASAAAVAGTSMVKSYDAIEAEYDKFIYLGEEAYEDDGNGNLILTDYYVQPGDWITYRLYVKSDLFIGNSMPYTAYDNSFFDVTVCTDNPVISNGYETLNDNAPKNPNHPMVADQQIYHSLTSKTANGVSVIKNGYCELDNVASSTLDLTMNQWTKDTTNSALAYMNVFTSDEWLLEWKVRVREDLPEGARGISQIYYNMFKIAKRSDTGETDYRRPADVSSADSTIDIPQWENVPKYDQSKSMYVNRNIIQHFFVEDTYMEFTIGEAPAGGMISTIVMLVLMVAVFYFFVIRPQKKQEKEVATMRNALQVGDEITTVGGIIGKIVSIKEETVMIETGNERTKIRILRSAVRNVDVKAEDAE